MTTTSDLSSERLDELEDQWNCEGCIAYDDMLALIAQARRADLAERDLSVARAVNDALREDVRRAKSECNALREVLSVIATDDPSCEWEWEKLGKHALAAAQAALAQPNDAGGA